MASFNSYFNFFTRFIFCFYFLHFQTFSVLAEDFPGQKELHQLNHPAVQLIESKLSQLFELAKEADNPANIERTVEIFVDLKFELLNQYQIDLSTSDALNQLENVLEQAGIKEAKNYLRPIKEKIEKAVERRYEEEKTKQLAHLKLKSFE